MTRLFISYSSKNPESISQLVQSLQNAGYDVSYDPQIRTGQWWSVILENLHGADIFLYAVTPDSYPEGIDSLFDPTSRNATAVPQPESDATRQSPAAAKDAIEVRPDYMAQYRAAHVLYADEHFAESLELFRALQAAGFKPKIGRLETLIAEIETVLAESEQHAECEAAYAELALEAKTVRSEARKAELREAFDQFTDSCPDYGDPAAIAEKITPLPLVGGGLFARVSTPMPSGLFGHFGSHPADDDDDYDPDDPKYEDVIEEDSVAYADNSSLASSNLFGRVNIGSPAEPTSAMAAIMQGEPLIRQTSTYVPNDDVYDDSFSIESAGGKFLGEMGCGVCEATSGSKPNRVGGIEVWLFDAHTTVTATKIVVSEPLLNNPMMMRQFRQEPISFELLPAVTGAIYVFETETMIVQVRIVKVAYVYAESGPTPFFDQLTIELSAWQKARGGPSRPSGHMFNSYSR